MILYKNSNKKKNSLQKFKKKIKNYQQKMIRFKIKFKFMNKIF